jgi:succinoglycan biosynthesis protein ExoA
MSETIGTRDPSSPAGATGSAASGLAGGRATGTAPVVTLIIPMLDERRRIRGCLESILAQDYPLDRVEILLVDGRSTDGTREIAREIMAANPQVAISLIDNEKRIPAAAMNLGILRARGTYVLRLDAHCEAAPDFIRKTIEVLDRTGAGCVGGSVTSVGEGRTARAVALAMSSRFGVGNAHFRYAREERTVDAVAYGAYRRAIFDEIGLYDEDLVYSEDNELNDRLTRMGRKVVLSPEIRVRYYTRETLPALWQQYFRYGRGRTRYMVRAPSSIRLRHLAPLALLAFLQITLLLGFFDERFWLAMLGVLGLWLVSAVIATLRIGPARGGDALALLPLAFACQHFGYGAGQCAGFFSLSRRSYRSRLTP